MPAKAGIQDYLKTLDSRLRGNDNKPINIKQIKQTSYPRRRVSSR